MGYREIFTLGPVQNDTSVSSTTWFSVIMRLDEDPVTVDCLWQILVTCRDKWIRLAQFALQKGQVAVCFFFCMFHWDLYWVFRVLCNCRYCNVIRPLLSINSSSSFLNTSSMKHLLTLLSLSTLTPLMKSISSSPVYSFDDHLVLNTTDETEKQKPEKSKIRTRRDWSAFGSIKIHRTWWVLLHERIWLLIFSCYNRQMEKEYK